MIHNVRPVSAMLGPGHQDQCYADREHAASVSVSEIFMFGIRYHYHCQFKYPMINLQRFYEFKSKEFRKDRVMSLTDVNCH